jgi:hypothetical protein
MRIPINIAKVYEKYRRGDSFTNAECLAVLEHYEALAKLLNVSGEPFSLAFREAVRIVLAFEGFALARKLI